VQTTHFLRSTIREAQFLQPEGNLQFKQTGAIVVLAPILGCRSFI